MASTSPAKLASEILAACQEGAAPRVEAIETLADWSLDSDESLAASASRALFTGVVEPLADLFEPRLCEAYVDVFSRVIAKALAEFSPGQLIEQYRQARVVREVDGDPEHVFVLSRVTLGADIAITSLILDAARRRFPASDIWLVSPPKSWELFERSLRIRHLPVNYGRRGLLAERLAIYSELREAFSSQRSLVLDPDSRLSQLGLLPVCPAGRHFLFESRAYGGEGLDSLPLLTRRWLSQTLGIDDAEPWFHPKFTFDFSGRPTITVSLGVGENPAKRIGGDFEARLLGTLGRTGATVIVDSGAPGSDEEERVQSAIAASGAADSAVGTHRGSFASFAAMIAASQFYVGYDSAGQHVAAALGVPLVSIFAGFASPRMMARWSPAGSGQCKIVPVGPETSPEAILAEVESAVREVVGA